MMGAVQPFISGAISKTVNLPNDATVEDIEEIHSMAWRLGVKSIAVYRDGCKAAQPLSGSTSKFAEKIVVPEHVVKSQRERLPRSRKGHTHAFKVGEVEGYLTTGEYEDGRLGEVFVRVSKQGSTLAGIVDAWSISLSMGLQHGVPLQSYVDKYSGMRFEPSGMTQDPDVRIANSLVDYIARRLAIDYLENDARNSLGIFTKEERVNLVEEASYVEFLGKALPVNTSETLVTSFGSNKVSSAHMCFSCGSFMRPSGACYVCENCGSTSGCS
jgi:ribonucleoside-diphosphate reductase alpha chain